MRTALLIPKPRLPIRHILLIGLLPSFLKKIIYRLMGYKIGNGVYFGIGSAIYADDVEIGCNSKFGFFTIVRGKRIRIGDDVEIRSMTFLDTPIQEIGNATRINEQVFVGGLQFPNSEFIVGKNCLIQQMSFLNPAPSIVIGDDTAIGGHNLIFGHVSWHNQFEGYPAEFKPIRIGNHVGLGWRAFILPGAEIGDGAMIGANSVVNRAIPPKCLAVGFPARVVSKYPDFPREIDFDEKVSLLTHIVSEMLDYFQGFKLDCNQISQDQYTIRKQWKKLLWRKEKIWRMRVMYNTFGNSDLKELVTNDLILSLVKISEKDRRVLDSHQSSWIDIENKECSNRDSEITNEVSLFLKRFGVRLTRCKTT